MDSFLLNKKGLEEMSILPKKVCNMHIARRNMHIAIESILPLTHTSFADKIIRVVYCGGSSHFFSIRIYLYSVLVFLVCILGV
jgi:hypothetical protein